MCDYSLHHVASRPAKVGDKLLTSKFFNTPTGGFAAADDPNVAVCLLAGTEIAFEQDVELRARARHLSEPQAWAAACPIPTGQYGPAVRASRCT